MPSSQSVVPAGIPDVQVGPDAGATTSTTKINDATVSHIADQPGAQKPAPGIAGEPASQPIDAAGALPVEIGGRDGPEPTRFGDWEKRGRCVDF